MEDKEKGRTFAPLSKRNRALSSAGSERLPYKQRVGGSNPSAPTTTLKCETLGKLNCTRALSSAGSERLPYKQRVGGSNPSAPTRCNALKSFPENGRLAQLVQSVCLTSRGSAVRIRQRPPILQHPRSLGNKKGRLAQLVQSVCLTSRGSAVRIRQRPQNERPHVACGLFLFLKNAFLFETFGCARQSSNKFAFAHLGVTRTLPPLHIATKRTVLRASGRSRCAIR